LQKQLTIWCFRSTIYFQLTTNANSSSNRTTLQYIISTKQQTHESQPAIIATCCQNTT